MQQRLPSRLERPILFAHRGARAYARENTIDAFELGLRLGATGLESDVWLTADGQVVLDHDGVVRKGLRNRPLSGLRRDELPGHMPTLAELIETCGSGYHLSLDLKDPATGPAVIAVIRDVAPDMLSRVWLCSPHLSVIEPLRELDDAIRLVDSTRIDKITEGPELRGAHLAKAGIDAINMHHTGWTGGLVTLFHRFERLAFAWDLQFEHVLTPVLRMGIDAVYSDWPDRMVDVAAAVGPN